jgi:hypothetical protein
VEHTIDESFSGDGLIVASFRRNDANILLPLLSKNVPEKSLFGRAPDPRSIGDAPAVGPS